MKEEPEGRVEIRVAKPADVKYVYPILKEMEDSAKARGTGIAKRSPQALCQKIYEGKAVIALGEDGDWAGFSYIEAWGKGEFVSNSGLIVNPAYRGKGVARGIKEEIVRLSRSIYPAAKIFSITTGAAVMKLNHEFGFRPVTYTEITRDERFWDKCRSCVNYPILQSQGRQRCLCTAMLWEPHFGKQPFKSVGTTGYTGIAALGEKRDKLMSVLDLFESASISANAGTTLDIRMA